MLINNHISANLLAHFLNQYEQQNSCLAHFTPNLAVISVFGQKTPPSSSPFYQLQFAKTVCNAKVADLMRNFFAISTGVRTACRGKKKN